MFRKFYLFIFIFSFVSVSFAHAQTVDPNFNPHKLIEDRVFSDTQTFGGPEGIQKFLESKSSVLANTSPEFIQKLKEPEITMLKQSLDDPRPGLGRKRTAAELIWDASQSSGINPQVLLVTLNKEQGLITGLQNVSAERLQKALDRAMGFDCPDSTGCGNLFPGFYFQIFGNVDAGGNRYLGAAKSLMKSFNTPGGRGPVVNGKPARVGETVVIQNTQGPPYNAPAEQLVTIGNQATAALYRYTPHVFNGNYNFARYFKEWFRYANGTLIKITGDTNTFIIQNGSRQLVPQFVAQVRKLDLANTVTVSANEIQDYPQSTVLGPVDNTVVKVSGEDRPYVFLDNVKHPASAFVLKQRGLSVDTALVITPAEAGLFQQGTVLTPKDGSVIKASSSNAYYLVEKGSLKLFSDFTLKQRGVAKSAEVVADDELSSYPKQGFVAPLDSTLVRSQSAQTVYLVDKGNKRPITGAVFKNRGLSFKNVVTLSNEEVAALPIAAYAVPKEKTFFKVAETNQLFYFKDGAKHPISAYVAKQQGITADYTFSLAEAIEWFDGIAIPPRDGTIVKGDKDATVYLVQKKQLKPLSAAAFKSRKIKPKSIVVLPQEEVEAYAKGEILAK